MADLVTDAAVTAAWPGFANLGASERAALITAASGAIEGHCGRTFAAAASYTEALDGTGLARLWLEHRPIVSITSVAIDGAAVDNTAGDAWTFDPGTGALVLGDGRDDRRFADVFPLGTRNVVVVYTAGDGVPAPVQRATVLRVKALADAVGVDGNLTSERLGEYAYTRAAPAPHDDGLTAAERLLLRPYVRLIVV